jgi:hypothetical protein
MEKFMCSIELNFETEKVINKQRRDKLKNKLNDYEHEYNERMLIIKSEEKYFKITKYGITAFYKNIETDIISDLRSILSVFGINDTGYDEIQINVVLDYSNDNEDISVVDQVQILNKLVNMNINLKAVAFEVEFAVKHSDNTYTINIGVRTAGLRVNMRTYVGRIEEIHESISQVKGFSVEKLVPELNRLIGEVKDGEEEE